MVAAPSSIQVTQYYTLSNTAEPRYSTPRDHMSHQNPGRRLETVPARNRSPGAARPCLEATLPGLIFPYCPGGRWRLEVSLPAQAYAGTLALESTGPGDGKALLYCTNVGAAVGLVEALALVCGFGWLWLKQLWLVSMVSLVGWFDWFRWCGRSFRTSYRQNQLHG